MQIKTLLQAIWAAVWADHVPMVAAALAYYAVFGLLPAIAAAAALWGQFGDLNALHQSALADKSALPTGMADLLSQFLSSVPRGFGGGIGLAVNLGFVLVTSYSAAIGLISALNVVYDTTEDRSWAWRTIAALTVGVCGIGILFSALTVLAVPPLVSPAVESHWLGFLLWCRWPVLAVMFVSGLGALFRYAPSRVDPSWRSVGSGAVVAAVLWLATSAMMSFYIRYAGSFGRLYGSLGGIAVVLLWFYASAFAIMIGAELDSVLAKTPKGGPDDIAGRGPRPERCRHR